MEKYSVGLDEPIQYMYPNVELSAEFSDKFYSLIEPKQCYDNIFKIILNGRMMNSMFEDMKIVYGGVEINGCDNLFAKHCFLKYEDKIIDPTIYKNNRLTSDTKYFSIIEYNIEEYLDMTLEYKEASPYKIMREMNEAGMKLLSQNIIFLG